MEARYTNSQLVIHKVNFYFRPLSWVFRFYPVKFREANYLTGVEPYPELLRVGARPQTFLVRGTAQFGAQAPTPN